MGILLLVPMGVMGFGWGVGQLGCWLCKSVRCSRDGGPLAVLCHAGLCCARHSAAAHTEPRAQLAPCCACCALQTNVLARNVRREDLGLPPGRCPNADTCPKVCAVHGQRSLLASTAQRAPQAARAVHLH